MLSEEEANADGVSLSYTLHVVEFRQFYLPPTPCGRVDPPIVAARSPVQSYVKPRTFGIPVWV